MLTGYLHLFLAILFFGTLCVGIPAYLMLGPWLRHRTEARLQQTGEAAMARILAVRETGRIYNNRSEARIELEVTHPGRGTWQASFKRIMGIEDIQYFIPGRIMEVRFDPTDPSTVAPAP